MDKFGLVEQFPEVQFIRTLKPVGAAEARNLGIKQAKGNALFFIDADCIAFPDWIEAFFKDFSKGWKVVGGGVKSPIDNFWLMVYNLSMFHEQLWTQPRGEHFYLPTLNLALQREVVEDIGLLNEELMRGQDIEWTLRMTRAGYHLLFDPLAIIEHNPPRHNFEALKKDNYRSGYYMIQVRFEHPEIFNMPHLLQHAAVWQVFKPIIAAWTTLRIVLHTKEVRQHTKIIPYIYWLKIAWCKGATDRLKESKAHE